MYLPFDTSKRRLREAQNARNNRAEIVKALSHGQINRRDLFKWGLFTSAGLLLCKNGLSPFASSVFAQSATGVPPTPLNGALPFTQPLKRLNLQHPTPLSKLVLPNGEWEAAWPDGAPSAKRLSWHTDFSQHAAGNTAANPFINVKSGRGPLEGRPPGEWFGHQRWKEFFPRVGYDLSCSPCSPDTRFHPAWPAQDPNKVWGFYEGKGGSSHMPPPLQGPVWGAHPHANS